MCCKFVIVDFLFGAMFFTELLVAVKNDSREHEAPNDVWGQL